MRCVVCRYVCIYVVRICQSLNPLPSLPLPFPTLTASTTTSYPVESRSRHKMKRYILSRVIRFVITLLFHTTTLLFHYLKLLFPLYYLYCCDNFSALCILLSWQNCLYVQVNNVYMGVWVRPGHNRQPPVYLILLLCNSVAFSFPSHLVFLCAAKMFNTIQFSFIYITSAGVSTCKGLNLHNM